MWAAWIADGRETTAEIRGAEDDDVRRKQRQDLGLRRLRGGRTHPLKPYREEEAARGREPPTSPTPRALRAGHTAARAHAPEQRRALFARSVLWAVARAGARRAKVAGGERGGGRLSRASHGGLRCFVFVRAGRTDDCSSWTLRGGRGSCLQSSVDSQSAKVLARAAESRSPRAASGMR